MQNFGYLVAAYLILWLGLFLYLLWMNGVQRALQSELSALRAAMQRRGSAPAGDADVAAPAELRGR